MGSGRFRLEAGSIVPVAGFLVRASGIPFELAMASRLHYRFRRQPPANRATNAEALTMTQQQIERELVKERRTMHRQKLLKLLWKLERHRNADTFGDNSTQHKQTG